MNFGPKHWPVGHLRELALPALLILVSLVSLDQYSKRQVQENMIFYQDGEDIDLYQGKKDVVFTLGERKSRPSFEEYYFGLNLHYSRNKGAAFTMFSKMPDHLRIPFFNTLTVVAVVVIFILFMRSKARSWCLRLGLSGAIGNFLDRLLLGYVIDFIDVEWHFFGWKHDFAVFNVADVAINVGVGLFVIDILREWREEVRNEKNASLQAS
jgi:signal peptidase II